MTNKFAFPPLIGHRGAKLLAPENTLSGFTLAAQLGVSWIEIDTTLCGSGECIIIHDDTLARCSDGNGAVMDFSLTQLQQLDAGTWFSAQFKGEPIPSLQQALQHINQLGLSLNLEIKTYQHAPALMAQSICQELTQAQFAQPLVISSFCHDTLNAIHQLQPEYALAPLFEAIPDNWLSIMQSINAVSLHCDAELLTAAQAQAITQAGYPILCYTVNDKQQAQRLWQWGVTSMFTDNPLLFK